MGAPGATTSGDLALSSAVVASLACRERSSEIGAHTCWWYPGLMVQHPTGGLDAVVEHDDMPIGEAALRGRTCTR